MVGLKRVRVLLVASVVSLLVLVALLLSLASKPTAEQAPSTQLVEQASSDTVSPLHIVVNRQGEKGMLTYSVSVDRLAEQDVEELMEKRMEVGDCPTVTIVLADSIPIEHVARIIDIAKNKGSKVVLEVP